MTLGTRSILAAFILVAPAWSADTLSPAEHTGLVRKYCAPCHTDAARNGGLTLQHYDAAVANPPLAAMLLSKLKGGAMGAAGIKVPDQATQDAWFAAETAQAQTAYTWTVLRTGSPETKQPLLVASIVREVPPRDPRGGTSLYRLTLTCNSETGHGEMQLSWSPQPQKDRAFSISADGAPAIPHKVPAEEEKMGNGSGGIAGLAAAMLHAPLPAKTLTVTDLFPNETVTFPLSDLPKAAHKQLAACANQVQYRRINSASIPFRFASAAIHLRIGEASAIHPARRVSLIWAKRAR